jgi:hypothetical protein
LRKLAVFCFAILFAYLPHTYSQSRPQASGESPSALLARARDVMGFEVARNRVLHMHAITAAEQNYQSDRMYPPFFSAMSDEEIWFDPGDAVLRMQSKTIWPGSGSPPAEVTIGDGQNAEMVRGEAHVPISPRQVTGRALNAWAVVADWSAAADVRVAGTEVYRDYPRLVLARGKGGGEERLYLDPKSGFPVKLEFIEPHYLWGQRHVEYVWSTWIMKDGVELPGSAFRLADGGVEISQTVGDIELMARESAPSLAAPPAPATPPAELPRFLQPIPPKDLTVSPSLHLLSNPGYTEAVALVNGEVYVFDATQSEERARQDKEQIARLFPGQHKINVVVTDLAWPHIAGVRYWVSQGATIISHASARSFLQKVVDRRWTLAADSLESERKKSSGNSRMKFVSVDREMNMAGGALRLLPIDGIGSEVALMAYIPGEKFLWASDYIQTLREPSAYANEVLLAAKRAGITPERCAAEHLPLSDWKSVQAAQEKLPGVAPGQ